MRDPAPQWELDALTERVRALKFHVETLERKISSLKFWLWFWFWLIVILIPR